MIIANPIYDAVFKYLLEDNEIAKILISNILNLKNLIMQTSAQKSKDHKTTTHISLKGT